MPNPLTYLPYMPCHAYHHLPYHTYLGVYPQLPLTPAILQYFPNGHLNMSIGLQQPPLWFNAWQTILPAGSACFI